MHPNRQPQQIKADGEEGGCLSRQLGRDSPHPALRPVATAPGSHLSLGPRKGSWSFPRTASCPHPAFLGKVATQSSLLSGVRFRAPHPEHLYTSTPALGWTWHLLRALDNAPDSPPPGCRGDATGISVWGPSMASSGSWLCSCQAGMGCVPGGPMGPSSSPADPLLCH